MFSSKRVLTQKTKRIIEIITLSLMVAIFFFSCVAYSFKNSIIFPIINAITLFASFFIFRSKYRVYALFLGMPFIVLFNFKELNIGSFYSYLMLIYCAVVFLETIIKKKKHPQLNIQRIIVIFILALYSLILTLINSGFSGVIKTISIFGYLMGTSCLFIDFKAKKDVSYLLLILGISMLISNVLAYFILYVVKGEIAINFLSRFTNAVYAEKYMSNNSSFRYPGFSSDPNYLGFYVLLYSSIVFLCFKRIKFKYLIAGIAILLQIFPVIGASKNYFLVIIILALGIVFYLTIYKKKLLFAIGILFAAFLVLVIFSNSILYPVLARLLNNDTRIGFLDGITTGRTTLQAMYLSHFLSYPSSFIIGNGFTILLNNASAHSVYVMTFWYFGLPGTFLYYWWLSSFFRTKISSKNKFYYLPAMIILIFALSLDFVSYSELFLFILYIYSRTSMLNFSSIDSTCLQGGSELYEITF